MNDIYILDILITSSLFYFLVDLNNFNIKFVFCVQSAMLSYKLRLILHSAVMLWLNIVKCLP